MRTPIWSRRRALAAVSGATVLLVVAGCSAPAGGDSAPAPEELDNSKPEIGPAPLVEITFEWEGEERTISGTPDRAFCNAGPVDMFTSTAPLPDAGVSAGYEKGALASVMAWATEDLAVSFQGRGEVARAENAAGETVWVNSASGDAWVVPADQLGGERISQTDLKVLETVPAKVSFSMGCLSQVSD